MQLLLRLRPPRQCHYQVPVQPHRSEQHKPLRLLQPALGRLPRKQEEKNLLEEGKTTRETTQSHYMIIQLLMILQLLPPRKRQVKMNTAAARHFRPTHRGMRVERQCP